MRAWAEKAGKLTSAIREDVQTVDQHEEEKCRARVVGRGQCRGAWWYHRPALGWVVERCCAVRGAIAELGQGLRQPRKRQALKSFRFGST